MGGDATVKRLFGGAPTRVCSHGAAAAVVLLAATTSPRTAVTSRDRWWRHLEPARLTV
jgi:hypothetical protein